MISIKNLSLQIFADDAGGATAGAQASSQDMGASVDNAAQGGQQNSDVQEKKPFKELIQGVYKDDYEKSLMKRMKGINSRLQAAEERNQRVQPVFEKLAFKYGISDPNDIDSILNQIDKDNSYYEDFAMQEGVSVEQARKIAEAERIVKANERRQQEEIQNQQFNEQMQAIISQGEALKAKYPSFDLDTEMQNEQFRRFVFTGISVEDAFTVMHRDELMSGAMAYAYNQAQQDFADTQRANAGRPVENGTSAQQAAIIEDDMTKLSQEQIDKLKAAVRSGQRVTPENFRDYL